MVVSPHTPVKKVASLYLAEINSSIG